MVLRSVGSSRRPVRATLAAALLAVLAAAVAGCGGEGEPEAGVPTLMGVGGDCAAMPPLSERLSRPDAAFIVGTIVSLEPVTDLYFVREGADRVLSREARGCERGVIAAVWVELEVEAASWSPSPGTARVLLPAGATLGWTVRPTLSSGLRQLAWDRLDQNAPYVALQPGMRLGFSVEAHEDDYTFLPWGISEVDDEGALAVAQSGGCVIADQRGLNVDEWMDVIRAQREEVALERNERPEWHMPASLCDP